MTSRLHRFIDGLRDERGMALVMALGMSFVLGILGASVILFTTSNERHSNRVNAATRAYSMGQAGIDSAASQLAKVVETTPLAPPAASFFSSMPVSDRSDAIDNGAVTWDGTRFAEGAGFRWHVTATATLPDPTAAGGNVTRVVSADVFIRPDAQQVPNTDAWKYVYSKANDGDPNTCDQTIYNNPAITSSFYVNGDLCLDNSSNVYGPAAAGDPEVNVIVRGRAYLNHPATSLGTLARPLSRIETGLGCKYRSNPVSFPLCGPVDRVWNNAPPLYLSLPLTTTVTVPASDHVTWYSQASPGPSYPCMTSTGTPPAFDTGDGLKNRSVGTVDLAPGASYTCKTTMGELSWDAATKHLTIQGTVYIDGNVDFSSDGVISYEGSFGALYLTGSYRQRQTIICGKVNAAGDACDPVNWDAENSMVVVVTGDTGSPAQTGAGMSFEQSSGWQGALYSAGDMTFENNTWVQGPMIAERQVIQNSMEFHYIPDPSRVPFGAPGTPIISYEMATVTNFSG